MDFVSLVADIIPIKGGQCSFYFELPINRGFTHKKGVSIRHYPEGFGGRLNESSKLRHYFARIRNT